MNKIINFHHVTNPQWLENIIFYLKSKYIFVNTDTLYEFYQRRTNLMDTCHITIDDGDKSFYNCIYPALKKHNVPASVFVSPKVITEELNYWFQEIIGYNQLELKRIISDMSGIPVNSMMGFSAENILKTFKINQIHEMVFRYRKITNTPKKPFQNMTVNNLREVNQSGLVSIGAHTLNHPILKNEDDPSSRNEIKESIFELSTLLNQKIKYFAYPNGIPNMDFAEREKIYLRELDIHLSFTTESKNFSLANDTMSIPRIGVSDCESMSYFKSKMFIGSLWNSIVKVKPNGEIKERNEIIKIIDAKRLQKQV